MKTLVLTLIPLYLLILVYATDFSPLVEIRQGKLRGIVKKDWKGGDFYSFLSIPYARKPIDGLRFMIPARPEKWEGIFDANKDMPLCVQQNWMGEVHGQEDCLYLNVHTPELKTKDLKPVMVFIHGGGYIEGHGQYEMFGPEFLMPEDVVLVTINYRLGLFGFLNFENPEVGVFGNMALKDQNMALRWVQQNIEKFGGNPKSVTIFGESAGGASVHLHMLSPMSQGLFHKVIAMSGSALNPWAVNGQTNTGVTTARTLGYTGKSEMKMLPFLQGVSVEDLLKVQENVSLVLPIHEKSLIGPIVETIKDDISFLPNSPEELIASKEFKEVPVMFGFTNKELIIADTIFLLKSGELANIPVELTILHTLNLKNDKVKTEVANKIKNFYYKNKDSSDRNGIIDNMGDAWIYWGVYQSVLAHAKRLHRNLYLYVLSPDTELNYFKRLHPLTAKYPGTAHLDDLGYIFKTKYTPDFKSDSLEAKSMQNVVKLWTNFAKYGHPTPKRDEFGLTWKPVEEGALNFLNIGTEGLELGVNPYSDRMAFWEKLHQDYASGKSDSHSEL